jgi:hypothetical protein
MTRVARQTSAFATATRNCFTPRHGKPSASTSGEGALANDRVYSRPGPGDVQGRDYQTARRLSPGVLAELNLPRDADASLCGPVRA